MATTRRERLQEATRDEIKGFARQQMAREGNAAVSLRAIARDMGLSAPALYRYYPSRDDLITALVVDAYTALGDALEGARTAHAHVAVSDQAFALCLSYRGWALANPVDYGLIFGNPIPGYHAPADVTVPTVRRAFRPFLLLVQRGWNEGVLREVAPEQATIPGLAQRLAAWQQSAGLELPPSLFQSGVGLWCALHGMITLELFNHLQPILGDPHTFYLAEAHKLIVQMGMPAPTVPAMSAPP